MSTLALNLISLNKWRLGWGVAASLGAFAVVYVGITMNQALAVAISAVVLTLWANDKPNGLISAILFFMVKPLFVRIAYSVDKNISGFGGFDLLSIAPALLLAGLIIGQLYFHISSGARLSSSRTRLLLIIFSAIAFISIFSPANSILVGLGGFERNVLPNMLVLLTASFVFTNIEDARKLMKVLLVLGLVSCVYGIGQSLLGLYSWEKDWTVDVAFAETTDGWLTIGLSGVEFRLFSIFYNYMDFTFCNAFIFALAISYGTTLGGKWKKIRYIYVAAWAIVLLLSLERMPLLMSVVALAVVFYLKSDKAKRRRMAWKVAALGAMFIICLSIASPYLKYTGADKLIRLAELANPFAATSIDDRVERKWEPTIRTIASNPLGVGIGYGSETRANVIAVRSDYWVQPHNELLQKTLETGVIGGIIFLMLQISIFRNGWRLSHLPIQANKLGIGFVAATIGFWLCGMVNVPFSGSSGLLYWTLAGVVIAMSEKSRIVNPQLTKKMAESADISSS